MLRFALLNIEHTAVQNLWVSSFIYYCLFILFSRPTRYKICVTENVNQGHWTSDTLKLRLKSKLVKLINKYSSSKDVNVSGWGVEGACARVGALPPTPPRRHGLCWAWGQWHRRNTPRAELAHRTFISANTSGSAR